MRRHTEFRTNRSIFCEVMTFRIFSRRLPSAILNFEKFKFWINFRGRSQNLRQHTKFGQNRMIGGRRGHVTSLFAILDHTLSHRGGPNLLFKFHFGILITFGYIAILVFYYFAYEMPNRAHFLVNFGGSYPQNLNIIILTPRRHILR